MITKVGSVCIFVSDQDRAKAFYTEKLGLGLRTDQPVHPGASNRWLAVAPKGAQTDIILYQADESWTHYTGVIGKSQAVTLTVTGIEALYADLKAKGVEFEGELLVQPWGKHLFIKDSEGNQILLVEEPAGQQP